MSLPTKLGAPTGVPTVPSILPDNAVAMSPPLDVCIETSFTCTRLTTENDSDACVVVTLGASTPSIVSSTTATEWALGSLKVSTSNKLQARFQNAGVEIWPSGLKVNNAVRVVFMRRGESEVSKALSSRGPGS